MGSLMTRSGWNTTAPYEIRQYETRFAVETSSCSGQFMKLAGYIGVTSEPANDSKTKISMTAPVVMTPEDESTGECGTMKFILPAEFDDWSLIPEPTDPDVTLEELDPAVGVVHSYSGYNFEWRKERKMKRLMEQLEYDGLSMDEIEMGDCEIWDYNPPWTPFFLRRNEIWCPLTDDQFEMLMLN